MKYTAIRSIASFAILLSCIGVLPSAAAAQPAPKMGGTLRYATVTEVASLDPHVYAGSAWKVLIEAIYSPLVGYDAKGKIVSRLAERWETPDAKTTIFHLRKGVTFHDGTPFSAEDVKFSLDRILDQKTGATLRTNLAGVTVSIVDGIRSSSQAAEPNATLLSILALPEAAIVSKKWIEGGPNVKVQANGTGPFTLKAYEPSVRAMLEKNPKYLIKGQPYLNAVEFKMIKSDDARVNALRTNAVDMIDSFLGRTSIRCGGSQNLTVDSSGGAFMNLWFNATKKPYDDARVRKAFGYAIDRAGISKAAFFGHGTPIEGPPDAQ